MHKFKDNKNREWSVSITVGTLKRVREALDYDLLSEENIIERLSVDPVLLVDVLYVVCQPQAEQAGVSDIEFGESLAGDAVDDATQALIRAVIDFFPSRRREVALKAAEKYRAIDRRALELAETRLESPELAAEIEEELQKKINKPIAETAGN